MGRCDECSKRPLIGCAKALTGGCEDKTHTACVMANEHRERMRKVLSDMHRVSKLEAKLRSMGVDPDEVG